MRDGTAPGEKPKDSGARPASGSFTPVQRTDAAEASGSAEPPGILIVPTDAYAQPPSILEHFGRSLIEASVHRRGALTMYNVRSVLEEGKFVSTADAKRAGARREAKVTLRRPMKGGAVKTYEVVDNVRSLSKRDWSRVVAVFVANGKQYQFSGWPLKTPVEIFAQYCGFCLHYTDVRPDPAIKSWRVCVHPLPPALRAPSVVHALLPTFYRCPGAR